MNATENAKLRAERDADRELSQRVLDASCETWEKLHKAEVTRASAAEAEVTRLQALVGELVEGLRNASMLIDEITDLEGREGLTDYEFAEQVLALAHSKRDSIRALIARAGASNSEPPPTRPSDPAIIIAGIRQFGLAPDGSDLRDLEAAIFRAGAAT